MSTSTQRQWRVSNSSELGSALAEVRRGRGATQADIAEQIGVDRTYVARMETGLSTRYMQRIFAILRDAGFELEIVERDRG